MITPQTLVFFVCLDVLVGALALRLRRRGPAANPGPREQGADGLSTPAATMATVTRVDTAEPMRPPLDIAEPPGPGRQYESAAGLWSIVEEPDLDHAIVRRGSDVVSMKLVPDADRVTFGGEPRCGSAGSGDVALELWVGRSPVPPVAPE